MTRAEWLARQGTPALVAGEAASLLGQVALKAAARATGVVRISGNDAGAFLHAQFCADCRDLPPGQSLLTGWCSPQGRVLYLPRLLAGPDGLYALLPVAQVEAFCKRLRMFVLRAKVDITDLGASHGVITLIGTPTAGTPAVGAGMVWASSADGCRHWYVAPYAELALAWAALEARVVDQAVVVLDAIRRGEAELDSVLADQFLPQELDLDTLGGLSFDKGCYPGQEIVARVKFRGKVKRRPRRLLCDGAPPVPGTRVFDAAGAAVGTVLMAAAGPAAGSEALAVIDVDKQPARLADSTAGAPVAVA